MQISMERRNFLNLSLPFLKKIWTLSLPLWSKTPHNLCERLAEDQQNISAMKHDSLRTHPQLRRNIRLGKNPSS